MFEGPTGLNLACPIVVVHVDSEIVLLVGVLQSFVNNTVTDRGNV